MINFGVLKKRPTKSCLCEKRVFDVAVSLIMLIVMSPFCLFLALISAVDTKGSPLFVQKRMGRGGIPFMVLKFRTMNANAPADKATYEIESDQYISGVGRVLRKLSLDEIPQLINILKGDMSFVGPRPVVMSETELIRLRHQRGADTVRPGLSGLAQISGRDDVTVGKKAQLDAFYVENLTFWNDIKILATTFVHVLTSRGVNDRVNPAIARVDADEEAS